MNLCKDCKFYIKWSGNFNKSANWSDVIRKSEHLCTKTNQVNFSNKIVFTIVDVSGKTILNDYSDSFSTSELSTGVYIIHYNNKSVKLIVN